jgi:tRNA-dihydrouridine synthase B
MNSTELVQHLHDHPFVLAPMAGITDSAFRSFMKEMGAGVVVTELVSAHGIEYRGHNTIRLTAFEKFQSPIGIQLFGEEPSAVGNAAAYCEQLGCDFIDLNFGCPVPKVVKKGAGSALLKDPIALRDMLRATKAAISIPLTIKIRTGWDQTVRNAPEISQIAYDEGITWVAIHGRTRAQGYSGLADWDYIKETKRNSKIPIIGNGDIHTPEDAVHRLRDSECDAVMIGRGCLKNPWIFMEAMARHQRPGTHFQLEKKFEDVFARLKFYLEAQCDDHVLQLQLRKFAAWSSSGYPGAANFRKSLFMASTLDELNDIIKRYHETLRTTAQADTRQEAFLMGGHG